MTPPNNVAPLVATHWSPEQALAVFECRHALREAPWTIYGPQVQQAWRDQLRPGMTCPTSILVTRSDWRQAPTVSIRTTRSRTWLRAAVAAGV